MKLRSQKVIEAKKKKWFDPETKAYLVPTDLVIYRDIKFDAPVVFSGYITVHGNLEIDGNFVCLNRAIVLGKLTVQGNVLVKEQFQVDGDVYIDGCMTSMLTPFFYSSYTIKQNKLPEYDLFWKNHSKIIRNSSICGTEDKQWSFLHKFRLFRMFLVFIVFIIGYLLGLTVFVFLFS